MHEALWYFNMTIRDTSNNSIKAIYKRLKFNFYVKLSSYTVRKNSCDTFFILPKGFDQSATLKIKQSSTNLIWYSGNFGIVSVTNIMFHFPMLDLSVPVNMRNESTTFCLQNNRKVWDI